MNHVHHSARWGLLFCLMIAAASHFSLLGVEPAAWEFNTINDPDAQGFEITGCAAKEMYINEGFLRIHLDPAHAQPQLKKSAYSGRNEKAGDFDSLEVRMRIHLEPADSISVRKITFRWEWQTSPGKYMATAALVAKTPGEFEVYRIPLEGNSGWLASAKRLQFTLSPVDGGGPASGYIDIDYIRFIPRPLRVAEDAAAVAGERLRYARDLTGSLEKVGISIFGAEKSIEELQHILDLFDGKMNPGDFAREFDSRYQPLYQTLKYGLSLRSLRERSEAVQEILDMRKELGYEASSPLQTDLANLRKEVADVERSSAERQIDPASVRSLEKTMDTVEARSDAMWSGQPVWRAGLSKASFGRFGWVKQDGLLVHEITRNSMERNYFKYQGEDFCSFQFSPANAEYLTSSVEEISWASVEWKHRYRNKSSGTELEWTLFYSILSPGILVRTTARDLDLQGTIRHSAPPARIVAATKDGVRIFTKETSVPFKDLTENWLLLQWDAEPSCPPVLLAMQHRPDSVSWSADRLTMHRSAGIGYVALAYPYGVRPIISSATASSGTILSDEKTRCQRLAEALFTYPYKCSELFSVNRKTGQVAVRNKVSYLEIQDEWNTPRTYYAPLPPVLAFAMDKGYPAQIQQPLVDFDLPTKYGPYRAASGRSIQYDLPLPADDGACYLRTANFRDDQALAARLAETFRPLQYENSEMAESPLSSATSVYPSWNLLSENGRASLHENVRAGIVDFLRQTNTPPSVLGSRYASHLRSLERVEPFSGMEYLAYGWTAERWGKALMGDITNFSGMHLYGMFNYALYSGDWDLLRNNWLTLQRMFLVNQRRADWAIMGPDCMEYGAMHTIDMGPDSWKAPVAMAKIAAQIPDAKLEELAQYMAAKQSVPLTAAFAKRDWDSQYCNTWNRDKDIPEAGYDENSMSSGHYPWTNPICSANLISGCQYTPEIYALYARILPSYAARYEYAYLERFYPQWCDPKFKLPGKTQGLNDPGATAQHILLRASLGEETATLDALLRKATMAGANEKLSDFVNCHALPELRNIVASVLVGRDAPCRLVSWAPAVLLDACYDDKSSQAEIRLRTTAPTTIALYSPRMPVQIMFEGRAMTADDYQYDERRRMLYIRLNNPKEGALVLLYPDWKAPARMLQEMAPSFQSGSADEQICLAETEKGVRKQMRLGERYFNCPNSRSVDLSKYLNMSLKGGPSGQGSNGWLAMDAPFDLAAFPTGEKVYRGARFTIADPLTNRGCSAIGLNGHKAATLPKRVAQIPVLARFQRLFFLHACAWDAMPTGTELMRYVIYYEDGTTATQPVRSGIEVGDWWTPKELPSALLVGATANRTDNHSYQHTVGLYAVEWRNALREVIANQDNMAESQRPYKAIRSIDIESTGKAGVLVVFAITGELSE